MTKDMKQCFPFFGKNTLPLLAVYQNEKKDLVTQFACEIKVPDRTSQLDVFNVKCYLFPKNLPSTHLKHFNFTPSSLYKTISPSSEVSPQKCDVYKSYHKSRI